MNLAPARGFGWFACCMFSAGCSVGAGPLPEPEEGAQAMARAEPSPLGSSEDAVVMLRATVPAERLCSGTLVAPNLVLTSRHCVAYTTDGAFDCNVEGELINNPTGAGALGADLPAASIEIYGGPTPREQPIAVGAQVVSTLSTNTCKNDIAFLVLDRRLELPSAPVRIRVPTRRGQLATLIGYGSDGTTSDLPWPSVPRRRRLRQVVLDVGPDSLAEGVTTVRPRVLIFGGPSACYGDSGGPALSEITGAVMATSSIIDRSDCLDEDVNLHYTHTSAFERLALEAFAAAAAEPRFEDDRGFGDECAEHFQCGSGRCLLESEDKPVCTQSCEQEACPSDYRCTGFGTEVLCAPVLPDPCGDCGNPDPQAPPPAADEGCSVARTKGNGALAGFLAAAALAARRRRPRSTLRRISTLGFAAVLALVSALGLVACGEDEVILGRDALLPDGGGRGGSAGSAGASGRGGSSGSSGGGSGGSSGQEQDGGDAAGDAGRADGSDGGDPGSDADASRCKPAPENYALRLCERLTPGGASNAVRVINPEFAGRVRQDCRVSGLIDLYDVSELPDLLNALTEWSFLLWGCQEGGTSSFDLKGKSPVLSAADARVLVDLYMEVASLRLQLSSTEQAEMREAVECLGARAVTNPSTTDHELSNCPPDAGPDAADAGSDAAPGDASADVTTE